MLHHHVSEQGTHRINLIAQLKLIRSSSPRQSGVEIERYTDQRHWPRSRVLAEYPARPNEQSRQEP